MIAFQAAYLGNVIFLKLLLVDKQLFEQGNLRASSLQKVYLLRDYTVLLRKGYFLEDELSIPLCISKIKIHLLLETWFLDFCNVS